jgi:hypothetical protein
VALLGSIVVKGKAPVFAAASVKEFRVVDLPLDGLPTIPINGSRGILKWIIKREIKEKGKYINFLCPNQNFSGDVLSPG